MIVADSAAKVDGLLKLVLRDSGFRLTYNVKSEASGSGVRVDFNGADVPHLLARNAELLLALEHVATQAMRLGPEQHDLVSFDAGGYKQERDRALTRLARQGVESVLATGAAYHFRSMNSRERRLLHLALASSGLHTQSEGEGPARHLVLHPKAASGSLP